MRRLCSIVDILGGEVLPDAPGVHKIVLGGKIEKDAQKMRDYLGASASEPIRNLIQLLENRGILVYSCDIDNDAFSGMNGKHIEDEEYEDCIQKLVDKNGGKVRLPKHELEIRLQRARRKGRDTMQYNNTLCYYNSHADKFYETTVNVAFTTMYKPFLSKLKEVKENPSILDFGCGSGRDTKYFLEHGYQDIIIIRIYGLGFDSEKVTEIPEGTRVYHIAPRQNLGGILLFDRKQARKNMKLGY